MKRYFQYIIVVVLLLTFQNKVAASEQFSRFSINSFIENFDYNIVIDVASERSFDVSLFNEFSESSNSLRSSFPDNLEVKEENETDEEQRIHNDSLVGFAATEIFLATEFFNPQDGTSAYSNSDHPKVNQELHILFGVFLI